MAGIGKTQTALKFADSYRSKFTAVLWTSAVNGIKMSQGYDRFAELLDLPERSRTEQHVRINAAKRWLDQHARSAAGQAWLLILDNVNKESLPEVFDYLPSTNQNGGSILLTTRSHEAAARLVGSGGLSIELGKMDQEEGTDFLLSAAEVTARDSETRAKATSIVSAIGNLPLVLDQVAFIAREAQGDLDSCIEQIEKNKSMVS
jgi:NB-ARC domain